MKKLAYVLTIAGVAWITAHRITQISRENEREIFNAARTADEDGVPAEIMPAKAKTGFLHEPVAVRNGNIFVSGSRIDKFKLGQKLTGGGRILSVAKNINLDTGLFTVKASGPSGDYFLELEYGGIFVPLAAIADNTVLVLENENAAAQKIAVVASDAEHAVVTGLKEGQLIILTKVEPGSKIKPIV